MNMLKLNSDKTEVLVIEPYSWLGIGCKLRQVGFAVPQKDEVHCLPHALVTLILDYCTARYLVLPWCC